MNQAVALNNEKNYSDDDQLRFAVQSEIDHYKFSQATLARESKVHPSALSSWLNNKYTGDNEKVSESLRKWLSHRALKKESSTVLPAAPDWVKTPTSSRIEATLSYAQLAGDLVVIYGGAGVGKTKTIANYRDASPSVWVMETTPTSGTVGGFLRALAYTINLRLPTGHSDALDIAIRDRLRDTGGLLIIDEAQFLNERALEAARRIAELANIGLALVGNETVYAQLTGRHRAANFAQLFSRIGKRLRLTRPTQEDTNAITKAWGIEGRAERDMIIDIASKPGGLRGVTKTLRLANMLAAGKSEQLDINHIRSAWRDLGGE